MSFEDMLIKAPQLILGAFSINVVTATILQEQQPQRPQHCHLDRVLQSKY